MGMVPVPNADFIYGYTLKNPNVTQFGISFNQTNPTDLSNTNIQYQLWYNSTETINGTDVFGREFLSMFRAIDEAISNHIY
jgi:hypothetical protein